jgi:hypothetical protein
LLGNDSLNKHERSTQPTIDYTDYYATPSIHGSNNKTDVEIGVFYVRSHILIAKERIRKHVPAKRNNRGHPFYATVVFAVL